jgi:hypothetical protein
MTVLIGYDLGAEYIIYDSFDDFAHCCECCQNYTGCDGFTWGVPAASEWIHNNCWLKRGHPNPTPNSDLISAHYQFISLLRQHDA